MFYLHAPNDWIDRDKDYPALKSRAETGAREMPLIRIRNEGGPVDRGHINGRVYCRHCDGHVVDPATSDRLAICPVCGEDI